MIQWSLAHEIGHIILEHLIKYEDTNLYGSLLSYEEYSVLEKEADFFAREILGPTLLLKLIGVDEDSDAIKNLCNVSKTAAENIKKNIQFHSWKNIHKESKEFILKQFFHCITRKEYHNLAY